MTVTGTICSHGSEQRGKASASATQKLHWSKVLDRVASVTRTPGVAAMASGITFAALCLCLHASPVFVFSVLAVAVALVLYARRPAATVVHMVVDNSNAVIPLLSDKLRLSYKSLRATILRDPAPAPEWLWFSTLLQRAGATGLAGTVLTRSVGTLYVCGSGHPDRAPPSWCEKARDAGFTVTILSRLRKAEGHTAEQAVDDVIHKRMANVTMDACNVHGLRWLARCLGLGRPVLALVSGDGNSNGGAAGGDLGGFPDQIRRAVRHGMHAEVWSWNACLSANFTRLAATQSRWAASRLTLCRLDDHKAAITFAAPNCRTVNCSNKHCAFTHPQHVEGAAAVSRSPRSARSASPEVADEDAVDGDGEDGDGGAEDHSLSTRRRSLSGGSRGSRGSTGGGAGGAGGHQTRVCAPHPHVHIASGPSEDGHSWGRGARSAMRARTSQRDASPSPPPARPASPAHELAAPLAAAQDARKSPPPAWSATRRAHTHGPSLRWSRNGGSAVGSDAAGATMGSWARGGARATSSCDQLTRFTDPCRYGIRCTLRKCGYTHPAGWVRPPLLPTDVVRATRSMSDRHSSAPSTSPPRTWGGSSSGPRSAAFRGSVECRYGLRCTNSTCGFAHPAEWERPSDFGGAPSRRRESDRRGRRDWSPPRLALHRGGSRCYGSSVAPPAVVLTPRSGLVAS